MRVWVRPAFLAGLICWCGSSLATPRVEVESIGFGQHFRPDAWCPVLVRITPDSAESREYQLRIRQRDLDGDEVSFTRTITLTGGLDGEQRRPQKFWTYFRPEPLDGGLPDGRDPSGSLTELRRRLHIELADPRGRPLSTASIADSVLSLDSASQGPGGWRGARLVLVVGSRRVATAEYTRDRLPGLAEGIVFVQLPSAASLPDDAIGYQMVDAIVWLDADASELRAGGESRLRAIEKYVRGGGRLVVCTPAEPSRIAAFSDWLPVTLLRMEDRDLPEPMRSWAVPRQPDAASPEIREQLNRWQRMAGPFRVGLSRPHPNAIVEHWLMPEQQPGAPIPWLARRSLGFGSVTWVAHDLGDPRLTGVSLGWSIIWSRVLGFPDDPRPMETEADRRLYAAAPVRDLGVSAVQGLDVTEQSFLLVTIALVFFVIYWAVAGPISFFALAARKRAGWSWAAFAAIAIVSTVLTLLVVTLVLRGPPELRHVSVVRASVASNVEQAVHARLGLYIPRNGPQEVSVAPGEPGAELLPLSMHPTHALDRQPVLAPGEYDVDLSDRSRTSIPFRSTLKKLQAGWLGPSDPAIVGTARVATANYLAGTLSNQTGRELRQVYFICRESNLLADQVLHLPSWKPGETIDLNALFATRDVESGRYPIVPDFGNTPDNGKVCRGRLNTDWAPWWFSRMGGGFGESGWNDAGSSAPLSVPLLSVFGRVAPSRNTGQGRVELLRRGARQWDASSAVLAGALLIVATSDDTPLPGPLEVNGRVVAGRGRTIWQFVVPVDRGTPTPPETAGEPVGPTPGSAGQ